MSFLSSGSIVVADTVTLLASATTTRSAIEIANNETSATLYIGGDAALQAGWGLPVKAGTIFTDSGTNVYYGAWYGITSSGSCDARVAEWYLTQINGVKS